jgi:hypothetical protein
MSDFDIDDILNTIRDPSGESDVLTDLESVYNTFGRELDYEDKLEWLTNFIENGLLSDQNLVDIYDLIPDGTIYEFPATEQTEGDNIGTVTNRYIKTPEADLITKERAAFALMSDILGTSLIYDPNEFIQDVGPEGTPGSDYQYYQTYSSIEPGFVMVNSVSVSPPVGFFPKLFPDDEHLKFNFNSDDENLFCVFSALFKQSDKLYVQCNLLKPTNQKEEREFYMNIISKCNLNSNEVFAITSENVQNIYDIFCESFKLNMNITYYYLKKTESIDVQDEEPVLKKINLLPHKTLKYAYGGSKELLRLTIAKLENHMFNINMTTTKRKEAIMYLQKIALIYDSLPDRKIRQTIKEVNKLSREHAKDFSDSQKEKLKNPDLLLKDIDIESCYIEPTDEGDLGTISSNVVYVPFVFDFETVLNDKNEHFIYSYVIKKVNEPVIAAEFYYEPFNKMTDRTNPIVKLFEFVINNTKEHERAILFAHNGARFDNLIVLKLASETYGMDNFREINAGPNNDIMLSLDITYTYKKKRNDVGFLKKVISFRDSYKLLDCSAANIPANYGTTSFKLPYCYNLYNEMFKIAQDKTVDARSRKYKMKNFFQNKDQQLFTLRSCPQTARGNVVERHDTHMAEAYDKIYNGTYDFGSEFSGLKKEFEIYMQKVKKAKVYYLPEEYCIIYNKYDVYVVEQGLLKMQEYIRSLHSVESICSLIDSGSAVCGQDRSNQLKKKVIDGNLCIPITKDINIFNYRSLASLVFDIAKKAGVFDKICMLTGNLKKFIQLSVVGGRVMKNPQEELNDYRSKFYDYFMDQVGKDRTPELDEEILDKAMLDSIIDNDAVSLYPSAISLCRMPAGKPTIFNIEDENQQYVLDNFDKLLRGGRSFYCLDIETQKDLEFPILSEKDEGGIRRFRNGKFHKLVLGDITLKDAIKYQNAKVTRVYTMVRFEGTCDRFAQFIKTLFTLRLIFKAIKLPCQNTIKLMMNSSYGRTILKQCNYKKMYKRVLTDTDKVKFSRFLSKNYYYIKPELNKVGNFIKVQKRSLTDNPSGYPHVGSHILEVSKFLMNKMFNRIYEKGLSVYYTDTDSIHVKAESLNFISDMLGEDMTQFHSDFGEVGYRGLSSGVCGPDRIGIFAIRSVFVMKKCYYDKLFCINNKTNKYEIIEHKRVKGITSEFMDEKKYEMLLNGDSLECDLCQFRDLVLRKTKAGTLVTLNSFKRAITKTD